MEPINARSMLDAAAAAAVTATADRPPVERRQRLSQAALAVANQKVRRAYSPVVIAGAVRLADFVLLSLIGVALYLGYVAPLTGFHWEYVVAILGMTATAVMCFQASDIYQVQVFRGQLRQMTRMISSWAFVFLLFIGASFLAKLGGEISRLWLSAFFLVGLAALIGERLFLRGMVHSRLLETPVIGVKLPEQHEADKDPKGDDQLAGPSHAARLAARAVPGKLPRSCGRRPLPRRRGCLKLAP